MTLLFKIGAAHTYQKKSEVPPPGARPSAVSRWHVFQIIHQPLETLGVLVHTTYTALSCGLHDDSNDTELLDWHNNRVNSGLVLLFIIFTCIPFDNAVSLFILVSISFIFTLWLGFDSTLRVYTDIGLPVLLLPRLFCFEETLHVNARRDAVTDSSNFWGLDRKIWPWFTVIQSIF